MLQLRFARNEFQRAIAGVSDEDARRRLLPMNCISWNVGHLAWQEQRNWLQRAQNRLILPELNDLFAYGAPANTPPLEEMWAAWRRITAEADPWLDAQTTASLCEPHPVGQGAHSRYLTFGTLLLRTTYHYWYHTGENCAIRQQLGHTDLPQFVGNIDDEAPYLPE